jgi:hypothetical protein
VRRMTRSQRATAAPRGRSQECARFIGKID